MKLQSFEFTGLRKNGRKETIVANGATLRDAERTAKQKLVKILQTVRKPDVDSDEPGTTEAA